MYPTNNLKPIIRYPLAVIVAFLAGVMFLALLVGAIKIGEWLTR